MTACPKCGHEIAPPKLGLTENQRVLLDYIKSYRAKNRGRSPNYEEMRKAMMLASKSGIHRMVQSLIKRGHIKAMTRYGRSVVPVE